MSGSRWPLGDRTGSKVIAHTSGPLQSLLSSAGGSSSEAAQAASAAPSVRRSTPGAEPPPPAHRRAWGGPTECRVRAEMTASAPALLRASTARESALVGGNGAHRGQGRCTGREIEPVGWGRSALG